MNQEEENIFHSILLEDSKLDSLLQNLRNKSEGPKTSVTSQVQKAANALEWSLEFLIKNSNTKTHHADPSILKDLKTDQLAHDLRRIGVLARRIEREIIDYRNTFINK